MNALRELLPHRVRFDVPLATLTTFGLGGPASALAEPNSVSELASVLRLAREKALPVFFLGHGSNVLFGDRGFPGVVLRLGAGFSGIDVRDPEEERVPVEAGSGASLARLIDLLKERGLAGLEFLAGIPGSVGGALAMNAGAFGGEISQSLTSLRVLDSEYEEKRLARDQVKAEYRRLILPEGTIILGAIFSLIRSTPERVKTRVNQLISMRQVRQPIGVRSAGSIFKNPPGRPAGELIELAGLKGRKLGQAWVSEKHANFIVHKGQAKASDVLKLIKVVQGEVKVKFGVDLEPEIKIVWPDNDTDNGAG